MKAKKITALVLALVLVFAISSVALAIGSPIAGVAAGSVAESGAPVAVTVTAVDSATAQAVTAQASAYIAQAYGAAQMLAVYDVDVVAPTRPVTISLNVAGVKVGDKIVVAHQKADVTMEYLEGTVTADGVVAFTLTSFSPVAIFRVGAASSAPTLYKTGDTTSTVSMVLLAVAGLAAIAVCGKALKAK